MLGQYFEKHHAPHSDLGHLVAQMANEISRQCSANQDEPRQLDFQETNEQRLAWFTKRKFDNESQTIIDEGSIGGAPAPHGPAPRDHGDPKPHLSGLLMPNASHTAVHGSQNTIVTAPSRRRKPPPPKKPLPKVYSIFRITVTFRHRPKT